MTNAERYLFAAKMATALGSGLMAGVFFAFSAFVMGALAKLPPAQGLAAMQSINIRVLNPIFLGAFVGTAAACLALLAATCLRWSSPGSAWAAAGCLLYLIGTFGVTAAYNVPLNDALALVTPGAAGSEAAWSTYIAAWTAWNHVRTLAAVAASAALIVSISWWAAPEQRADDVAVTSSSPRRR